MQTPNTLLLLQEGLIVWLIATSTGFYTWNSLFYSFRAYDPADYEHLHVSQEIKELFQYITRYVVINFAVPVISMWMIIIFASSLFL